MSTVEDFRYAPVGATATHKEMGARAMKLCLNWILQHGSQGIHVSDEEMVERGYTLDPPVPTSAGEALDLAWEIAHPVKGGQVIPEGTRFLQAHNSGLKEYTAAVDFKITPGHAPIRTLEPLPVPEPDWLNAPAVLARLDDMTRWDLDERQVFTPAHEGEGRWVAMFSALTYHWSELRDVTPLYPKGQEARPTTEKETK